MLRYPMHGFAKRVDDAVARAMGFLRAKEMAIAKPDPPASNPDIWQAMAKWKEPASSRWQLPAASRHRAPSPTRPRPFRYPMKSSQREEGHQRSQGE
jgi:hypothetical protein